MKTINAFDAAVGARVREQRVCLGWTLRELALEVGISTHVQMLHIEQGKCGLRAYQIARLADVLDVTTDWLLGGR